MPPLALLSFVWHVATGHQCHDRHHLEPNHRSVSAAAKRFRAHFRARRRRFLSQGATCRLEVPPGAWLGCRETGPADHK